MTLDELRADIDRIDASILELLAERLEKGLLTKRLKTGVLDPGREAAVLEGIRRNSRGLLKPDFAALLYRLIMAESRAVQAGASSITAYVGQRGSPAEDAARALDPDAALVSCATAAELEELLSSGLVDRGQTP